MSRLSVEEGAEVIIQMLRRAEEHGFRAEQKQQTAAIQP
jgi:hypothetical protein